MVGLTFGTLSAEQIETVRALLEDAREPGGR